MGTSRYHTSEKEEGREKGRENEILQEKGKGKERERDEEKAKMRDAGWVSEIKESNGRERWIKLESRGEVMDETSKN